MIWLCSTTLEDNPKDLNKNKGLKTSPLFLFIYWSYLYVSTCAIPLFQMAQEVKYSLFMGESAQVPYPIGLPKSSWLFGKRKNAGNPNEPSEFFVARPFWRAVLQWCQRLCLTSCTHLVWKMIWLCLIISEDNPKDLNKNKGLKLSPLFLFIYWSYLYVSTCAIPLFRMVQRSSTVFFMGAEPQRYPKQKRGYCVN